LATGFTLLSLLFNCFSTAPYTKFEMYKLQKHNSSSLKNHECCSWWSSTICIWPWKPWDIFITVV
jgi:hypothetical protein